MRQTLRNFLSLGGALAFLTMALQAQDPEPPVLGAKPAPANEDKIELGNETEGNKARVTRDRMSTLVDVVLTNEERVRGVIRNGRYVEASEGINYKDTERESEGAGMRVWHVAGATSFAFIPYSEIRSYRVVRTLSDLQVREFASQAREEARRRVDAARQEAMQRLAQRKQAAENAEVMEKLDDLAARERAGQERITRELAFVDVLNRFAPEAGWSPTRLVDIRRRVALDLFPSDDEKGFILAYDTWRPAYVWWTGEGKNRYETLTRARADLALEQAALGAQPEGNGVVPTVPPGAEKADPKVDPKVKPPEQGAPPREESAVPSNPRGKPNSGGSDEVPAEVGSADETVRFARSRRG